MTGVERYAIELIKYLDNLIEDNKLDPKIYNFKILTPRNILENNLKLKNIPIEIVGNFNGHLWEQLELPFYSRGNILFNPCNTAPILKLRNLVTIHDVSVFGYPDSYSKSFILWYKFLFKILTKTSLKIITDSAFSLEEIVKYCKINRDKVRTIYLGREHILNINNDNKILDRFDLMTKPFILAVSSLNKNKNFLSIVKAIEHIGKTDFDIVIAGNTKNKAFDQSGLTLPSYVKQVGYITDNELKSLYENTSCFIYPSFYEGFGFPPLEAMSCGSPVIASNRTSIPEVCGEAVIYCNPDDYKDLAEKIMFLVNNKNVINELREKSKKQAEKFTWKNCARDFIAVLDEVCK